MGDSPSGSGMTRRQAWLGFGVLLGVCIVGLGFQAFFGGRSARRRPDERAAPETTPGGRANPDELPIVAPPPPKAKKTKRIQ